MAENWRKQMKELDEMFEEIRKEVTPENVAKMSEDYARLPDEFLRDSIGFSLKMYELAIKRRLKNDQ